jgi:type II secretory ATPase GspE/PulE/Tfp pilus assembly ATPase PilB-like protein
VRTDAAVEPVSTASFADSAAAPSDLDEVFWLGQRLLGDGKITADQLAEAMRTHRSRAAAVPFSETLEMLQLVNPQRVAQLVGERHGLPFLLKVPLDRALARRVPAGKARARLFLPFREEDGRLDIAVADPGMYGARHAASDFPEVREYLFHVTPRQEVLAALELAWGEPVVVQDPTQFVDRLLLEAIELKASDVHFEPKERNLQIRRRVDGVLSLHANIGERDRAGIVRALKIRARMDIAENRLPQDGMFKLVVGARRYTFRVSTLPVIYGEKVQLRIGDDNQVERSYRELGMDDHQIGLMHRIMQTPHGAVLVTGPTGSGKSTLLFAAIATLPLSDLNAISMEEPVEFAIPGLNQVGINPAIGLTFAASLRHVLRQDPDVIIVGEMRDQETASLAVRAALTGHLCLATLHTNDACGAITRLVDLDVEPFLVSGAVRAVIAQRLVKRLCECKRPAPDGLELKRRYGVIDGVIYEPRPGGCAGCRGTGYCGRTGIFEIALLRGHGDQIDGRIRTLINGMKRKDAPTCEAELLGSLRQAGMRTLRDDGLRKVAAGITSLAEVLAET